MLRHELKLMFNPQFGSLFRTYENPTYFMRRLGRFADLYTSSLTNLLHYSPNHVFYPRRAALPHEPVLLTETWHSQHVQRFFLIKTAPPSAQSCHGAERRLSRYSCVLSLKGSLKRSEGRRHFLPNFRKLYYCHFGTCLVHNQVHTAMFTPFHLSVCKKGSNSCWLSPFVIGVGSMFMTRTHDVCTPWLAQKHLLSETAWEFYLVYTHHLFFFQQNTNSDEWRLSTTKKFDMVHAVCFDRWLTAGLSAFLSWLG